MALTRTVVALVLSAGAVSSFTPTSQLPLIQAIARPTTSSVYSSVESDVESKESKSTYDDWVSNAIPDNAAVFEQGMAVFAEQYPGFSKWGWGPTVHAEKWNGRHAMFGWFFICCTAYFKGHGLIPDANTMLSFKDWGSLALISGNGKTEVLINQERAVILIANVHCFFVGLCSTIAPLGWSDPLLLDPNQGIPYERAINTKPYGILPDMGFNNWGLTETAEIMNGRMAMFGLMMLLGTSLIDQKNMIDVVNEWVGNLYF